MCNATNYKSYDLGLKSITEVHKRKVLILENANFLVRMVI